MIGSIIANWLFAVLQLDGSICVHRFVFILHPMDAVCVAMCVVCCGMSAARH